MSGSITLERHEVDWLLLGALAAASKDDVTPILCTVQWTVQDGRVTVLATDRYRVHQLYVPAPSDAPDGSFTMSRFQAETIMKLRHSAARRLAGEKVRLTWVDAEPLPAGHVGKIPARYHGSVRVDLLSTIGDAEEVLSYSALQVRGNYPPVGRLFDDVKPDDGEAAPVSLFNPELLAATRHLRVGRGEPLRFYTPRHRDGANKMQPMLVMNHQGTARALVQSNIGLADQKEWGA